MSSTTVTQGPRRLPGRFLACTLAFAIWQGLACGIAGAAVEDGLGNEWRQLEETKGLYWSQVAEICPTDGATACAGSIGGVDLTHWVWATSDQVVQFMSAYEPLLLSADPPLLSGEDYFFSGIAFLGVMRDTGFVSGYNFYSEWTRGITATLDELGVPVRGSGSFGWWPYAGSIGVSASGDVDLRDNDAGVWLWRVIGPDYSAPQVTGDVQGVLSASGWYLSDVDIHWAIEEPDSALTAEIGCDPITLATDTAAVSFTCQATSPGGTGEATVEVQRDTTGPEVTCDGPPAVFQLGDSGTIFATVSDATSGVISASASTAVDTSSAGVFSAAVTGRDIATNETSVQCNYQVVVPLCFGKVPTIVGTGGNDQITGTPGRDIIVGLGGNDTINGGGGGDIICAGDGSDVVYGDAGRDLIFGDAGNDDLNGGSGGDRLDGGAGDDSIRGDDGNDYCTSGEVRMSSCNVY